MYEQNSLVTVETIWQDLAYGARLLRRSPGFAAVAILSIALGIGANASVFTLLDQVMLRALPVDRPGELVLVTAEGIQYGNGRDDGNELSLPMYQDLRDNNQVFSLLAPPAFWWLNRFVESQLYEVAPTDPASIASATGLLLVAAVLAVLVPSRRALRVNPMAALGDE